MPLFQQYFPAEKSSKIASRLSSETINGWRVPDNGPSKPNKPSRLMNSRRLHGVHRLTGRFLVKVDSPHDRQTMVKFESY